MVSARSESGLMSLVDEISRLGGEAISIPCDVAILRLNGVRWQD